MSIRRRRFIEKLIAATGTVLGMAQASIASRVGGEVLQESAAAGSPVGDNLKAGPDPLFEKPSPVTLAHLAAMKVNGVKAVEVNDYAAGSYKGELKPSPPHADMNPKKAIVVVWERGTHRLVFSHESSYDPCLELPNGVAMCNQFFEGNDGWAELFNNNGRKERNSFVDIVESGPRRVWVRWNYFCVNQDDDSHPALRGTEDYITYANGLVWRRLTYTTMMPEDFRGYSWQPIDFFALAPTGTTWQDLFPQDGRNRDYHVGSVIDAYSEKRYDKYWDDEGKPRRTGDAQLLLDISRSPGFAMILPFKAGMFFTIMGASSGFPSEKSQVVDHSFDDTGGWGWGAARWDHWPIGWLNSQTNDYKPGSQYPYHFGPFSHYIVNRPIRNAKQDFPKESHDMDLNRWSEHHVFYTLTGLSHNVESIRRLARQWLDKGAGCAKPGSIANLDA